MYWLASYTLTQIAVKSITFLHAFCLSVQFVILIMFPNYRTRQKELNHHLQNLHFKQTVISETKKRTQLVLFCHSNHAFQSCGFGRISVLLQASYLCKVLMKKKIPAYTYECHCTSLRNVPWHPWFLRLEKLRGWGLAIESTSLVVSFEIQQLSLYTFLFLLCALGSRYELSHFCSYPHSCHLLPCLLAIINSYSSGTINQNKHLIL